MPVDVKQVEVSIRVYDRGCGDRRVTQKYSGFYDVAEDFYKTALYDYTADGFPRLEFIEGIGLTCRAQLTPQDTRLSQYVLTPSASWYEVRPVDGRYRNYRIQQLNSSAGIQYSAVSFYTLPANPNVCIALLPLATPNDWDIAVYGVPYNRIEFGTSWAIQIQAEGTYLMAAVAGLWQVAQTLPSPTSDKLDEMYIYFRCKDGKIVISTDLGNSYKVFSAPDGSNITVPAGKLTLRGRGGMVSFGLFQLKEETGIVSLQPKDTGVYRVGPNPTFAPRYTGSVGSVSVTNLATISSRSCQFAATITAGTSIGGPWTMYNSPVLHAVTTVFPALSVTTPNTYTTPWDTKVQNVEITKDMDIDSSTATLTLSIDALSPQSLRGYRWRRVQIVARYKNDDGSFTAWTPIFTGHLRSITIASNGDEFSRAAWTVTIDNVAIRFKRREWTVFDQVPLGNITANDAADFVMITSEGLDAGYRAWQAAGAYAIMPAGLPRDPFELVRPGEKKWTTLKRIFGYYNLEPAPMDDGTFATVVKQAYDSATSWTFYADRSGAGSAVGIRQLVKSVNYGYDASQGATSVLVYGKLDNGSMGSMWSTDDYAENDPTNERFSPWSDVVQEQLEGSPTIGLAVNRCQALGSEYLVAKLDANVGLPLHLGVGRRQKVVIHGLTGYGIPDGAEYGILTLKHSIRVRAGLSELETSAGLRKIDVTT